jgi:hypothetical protein
MASGHYRKTAEMEGGKEKKNSVFEQFTPWE